MNRWGSRGRHRSWPDSPASECPCRYKVRPCRATSRAAPSSPRPARRNPGHSTPICRFRPCLPSPSYSYLTDACLPVVGKLKTSVEELGSLEIIQVQCPLRVISGRRGQPALMSAFGGKADVNHCVGECPLLAISGHSDPASATWRLQPYRPFPPSVSGLI